MSKPFEPDYVVIQVMVDGAYVDICGAEGVNVSQSVAITKRARRDCDKPAAIPENTIRVGPYDWSFSVNAVMNMDQVDVWEGCLGIRRDYRLLYGRYDEELSNGERTGTIAGYRDGTGVMESLNEALGSGENAENTADMSIQGEGRLTWAEGAPA